MKTAIYAGAFDPFTDGHRFATEFGLELFDKVIIAIGVNPGKHPLFTLDERLDLIKQSTSDLPNVEVDQYTGLYAVDYAVQKGANFLLRGIRNPTDFLYEAEFQNLCYIRNPSIHLVYAIPPQNLAGVSSSTVRGLCGYQDWELMVAKFVSPAVLAKLKEKFPATINLPQPI